MRTRIDTEKVPSETEIRVRELLERVCTASACRVHRMVRDKHFEAQPMSYCKTKIRRTSSRASTFCTVFIEALLAG